MKTLEVETAKDWRAWLKRHHKREGEIWLVYYKQHTGAPCVAYEASVEEALCFGWIDSLVRRLDDDRFARKFTPRKPGSKWSPSNKQRVARLLAAGRMTKAGERLVEDAKRDGTWDAADRPELPEEPPPALAAALRRSAKARATFEKLAPSHRRQYIAWIATAKREDTIQRRVAKSIALLEQGEKLGMV
ncbi:MAG: YdeI/OmpD-associated family protein [Nannocystaceae bacterium]